MGIGTSVSGAAMSYFRTIRHISVSARSVLTSTVKPSSEGRFSPCSEMICPGDGLSLTRLLLDFGIGSVIEMAILRQLSASASLVCAPRGFA
jgi:hypothetical protein